MAEALPAAKANLCPVCVQDHTDPRALDCLHALCAGCIDQLLITADNKGEVTCPLCRAVTRLPGTGAAVDLPPDCTLRAGDGQHSTPACAECPDGVAIARCAKCAVNLCANDIAEHLLTAGSHAVDTISGCARSSHSDDDPFFLRQCAAHKQPLMYFCVQCEVAVCGGCTAVGLHSGHKPVEYVHGTLLERKENASAVVRVLELDVQPRMERVLQATEETSALLTERASVMRARIERRAQELVDAIESCKQQLLLQVEDVEEGRHKALEQQKDELKTSLADVRNVIAFNERLQSSRSAANEQIALLRALNRRATSISEASFSDKPIERHNLLFLPAGSGSIDCSLIGSLSMCKAVAKHCTLRREDAHRGKMAEQHIVEGSKIVHTLQAKDADGDPLSSGGDHVTARWSKVPHHQSECSQPYISVHDEQDGSYTITSTPLESGEYVLEISVNEERIEQTASFVCVGSLVFDDQQCHSGILLSTDKHVATRSVRDGHASVLGSKGMQRGTYTWRIEIGPGPNWYAVGIASKPLTNKSSNFGESFSWKATGGMHCLSGSRASQLTSKWSKGDELQFVLDCDKRQLEITNLRNNEKDKMAGLPTKEFFVYVNMYAAGNFVKLK